MKYSFIGILIFITTNCFAISQNLIDGTKKYEIAIENLKKIEIDIKIKHEILEDWLKDLNEEKNKTGIFRSDDSIKFCQTRVDETKNQITNLNIQYAKIKETINELEPLKSEYDKQIEKEREISKFKASLLRIIGTIILPLCIFILFGWGIISQHKKYKRLLKEGKITQEEYNRFINTRASSSFSNNMGSNPATGLPMTGIGISDVGGNVRGSSPSRSNF